VTSPTAAADSRERIASHVFGERRRFGATDLQVSPVGLGCARIGGVFQGGPEAFVSLISATVDSGINFFDTADMYSGGESESILGRALAGRRKSVVIASKVGYVQPAQRRLAGRIKPLLKPVIRLLRLNRAKLPAAVRGALSQNFSPDYIRRAVEASLVRLRTDYIDVMQLHSPPGDTIRQGDWLPTLQALRKEGKIRFYGIACDTVSDAFSAIEQPGVASIQVTVNLLERGAVEKLLPAARERGIAVIARECLSNGLLAKDPKDIDPGTAYRDDEERARRTHELSHYRSLADQYGVPLPAMALKYALSHEGVSTALLGMRSPLHLEGAVRWFGAEDPPASAFATLP
jgi:aryl-alcohol dehydrogenase-like predicted oxidoreductase